MKYLLKHGHLIIDGNKEYLDGSVLVNDERIEDVFIHSNKVDELEYDECIDCSGKIIMPGFFDVCNDNLDYMNGVVLNMSQESNQRVYLNYENDKNNVGDRKIFIRNSNVSGDELDEKVTGISNLFVDMKPLSHNSNTLVNAAFTNKYYIEIDSNELNDITLKLVVDNIDKNKIMLMSNNKHKIGEQIKRLFKLRVKLTDIVLYSSLNACRLYNLDKQYGSISKGKYADLLILDDELNINKILYKGKIYD